MVGFLVFATVVPRRGLASKVGPRAGRGSFVQGWRSLLVAGLALTLAACASPSVPTQEPEAQPSTGEALPTTPQETYADRKLVVYGKSVSVCVDLGGARVLTHKNDHIVLHSNKLHKI